MKTKSKTDKDKKSGITGVRKVSQVGVRYQFVMGMFCGTGQFFQRGVAGEEVMDGESGDSVKDELD